MTPQREKALMDGRNAWLEACKALNEANAALDAAWKAFDKLASDPKASQRKLKKAHIDMNACQTRVDRLSAIERNFRRILEGDRLRSRKTDA
jgi:hypothetical protein